MSFKKNIINEKRLNLMTEKELTTIDKIIYNHYCFEMRRSLKQENCAVSILQSSSNWQYCLILGGIE